MIERLKRRWKIKHTWEIGVILLVFAITGTSTVFVYNQVKIWVGINPETALWQKTMAFILVAFPLYNLLLLGWGYVLGQGRFFRRFIKGFLGRLLPLWTLPLLSNYNTLEPWL